MIVLTRISLINLKNNRMDKLEYIPGDLVKFATNTYTIVNFGENFLQSKIYALISTNSTKTAFVEDRDILPIPLTPEILEKNGWELDSATWIYKKGYIKVFKLLDDKTYAAYIFEVRVFEFHFIHELQHLLFGLGINHEMEV